MPEPRREFHGAAAVITAGLQMRAGRIAHVGDLVGIIPLNGDPAG
jgi:hypothetical protein